MGTWPMFQRSKGKWPVTSLAICSSICFPPRCAASAGASSANSQAHGAFLKGRYWLNKGTSQGVEKAITQFEEATLKDPGYAVAHAGLAVALDLADHFRVLSGREAFPRAKAAALRALRAQRHASRGPQRPGLRHAFVRLGLGRGRAILPASHRAQSELCHGAPLAWVLFGNAGPRG